MGRKRSVGPRDVALQVLREVERADKNLSAALDEVLSSTFGLSPKQRNLVAELAYGVMRRRRLLDRAIDQVSRRPVAASHPLVARALRLAAYQILFLEDVNAAAATHHAVATARRIVGPKGAGYVNAVLRELARRRGEPASLGMDGDPLTSMPDWLADLIVRELGPEEGARLAASLDERPPTTLRANPARTSRERLIETLRAQGVRAEATRYSPWGIRAEGLTDPRRRPEFHEGLYEVQDEASQLVSWALGADGATRVLDACCGAGGKTLHLGQLHPATQLWAADAHGTRVRQAAQRGSRIGLRPRWLLADLTRPPFRPASFDAVLLDAPCSGLGALRRHPEAKWRWTPERIESVARLQEELLDAVSRLVAPGGRLLYVVCTFTQAEGPQQAARFLERHPEMERDPIAEPLFAPFRDELGQVRTWPHRHDMDAFFMARFKRKS